MIARRTTGLALALLLAAPPLMAQSGTPQAFLDSIYRAYTEKGFKGHPYNLTERYFASPLREAMEKDYAEARKRGEVPLLNGDPFIDAQDWEIANVAVSAWSTGPTTAMGVATFTNFGKPQRVTLELVSTQAGWRITEIKAPSGSLRAMYKLN
ncbi:MAG: DUF3828 domain-containing protein [Alphaproteobacteria bacterium]|nr:DUF3828 domain-containing protein [Alphaproteobacteria bacterium]MCW5740216.1 DUF3828 domain-containing protein [Alphaproteobacteria bacterium]